LTRTEQHHRPSRLFCGLSMDDIFKKTKELVRNNPADFQETTQSIIKKILKNNHPLNIGEVSKRFCKIWPDSKGKEVIEIGRLLSDTAIGTGMPSVPTALAEILTKRLSATDNNPNPANPQEWIRGHIFYQEESEQRLEDAVRAYETKNPLKDEPAGTAALETPTGQDSGKKTDTQKQFLALKSFIEIHCNLTARLDVKSKVALLYEYNSKGKIRLPKLAHKYRKGQHKYYYVDDLKKNWPTYQKEMPTLPPLKVAGN